MKTLPMLAAGFALTLWGCVHDDSVADEGDEPSMQAIENETTQAQLSRLGAPTVYNAEATGAPGRSVTTGDGRIWSPEEAPGNTVLRTESDVERSIRTRSDTKQGLEVNGLSEVIDEGPTNDTAGE